METREERQTMITALKREIAEAESALASLKSQAKEFEGVPGPGAETKLVKLSHAIREQEKAIKAAGEQLALRTGVKRGPGRPPKPAAEKPSVPAEKPSDGE